MGRKIVVTSGKGGVGKTTVTANLGIALAESGVRVVLVDADIGLNNLDVVLNVENSIVYDLGDAIIGRCRLKQALVRDPYHPNLELLASAKRTGSGVIKPAAFQSLIAELASNYDFVIIDCPAGIDDGFVRAINLADEALIVTTPHISAIRDADKVAGLLASYSIKNVGLVVNRVRGDLVAKGGMMCAIEVSNLLKIPLKGALPDDDNLTLFNTFYGLNLKKSEEAYKMLADNILGVSQKVFDTEKNYRGLLGKLRLFGK